MHIQSDTRALTFYIQHIHHQCVCSLCVCVSLHHRLLVALKRPSVLRKKTHRTAVRQQIWHGHHFQSLTNSVYIVYGEVGKWDSEVYDLSTKKQEGQQLHPLIVQWNADHQAAKYQRMRSSYSFFWSLLGIVNKVWKHQQASGVY